MKLVHREECIVRGLAVCTSNRNETMPQQAKIAGLWQDFFTTCGRADVEPSLVYGVYTNYGSDLHGEFDITADLPGDFPHAAMREVTIPAGSYLCFTKSGPCPATVIALWQEIWDFFQQEDAPARIYRCDFEEYSGSESVAIFIGAHIYEQEEI
jgi:predicted transcriptional regulator YdeE